MATRTWKETQAYIRDDIRPFDYYHGKRRLLRIWDFLTGDINHYRIRFCVHLRKLEYYHDKPLFVLLKFWHKYWKNRIGRMFSWEIPLNACGPGLHLWHAHVVLHDHVCVGSNALFHGGNCIGRKSDEPDGNVVATIGDNFELGAGANVIGRVELGDNVIVGANSLVISSFPEGNCIVVGVPARRIK